MSRAALALALVATTATARAQSTRYPPEPVDADREAEEYSAFWERALEPGRGRYDTLVTRARRSIDGRTPADLADARELLDAAIAILPDVPDAHFLRGWAHELAGDWAACADDYAAAAAADPDFVPSPNPRTRGGLADGQGACLARAGRFEDAEVVLSAAAAAGNAPAGLWHRLAEVDMALGRLDDAITATDNALAAARSSEIAAIHWLRAMVFDRARRLGDAADAAAAALTIDPSLSRALSPALPPAPAEDAFYLAGIALAARSDGHPVAYPERALLYFREYVARAGKGPWHKRAEEHVAELAAFDLAGLLARPGARQGTTALDLATIGKAVRKDVFGLSRCLAATPRAVAEVRIVLHGPAAPPPKQGQPVVLTARPPPAGATAKIVAQVGEPADAKDLAAATTCLEKAAGKLKVARLERGTWLQLTVPVVDR